MELFALLLAIKLEIFTVLTIAQGFIISFGDKIKTLSDLHGYFVFGILFLFVSTSVSDLVGTLYGLFFLFSGIGFTFGR